MLTVCTCDTGRCLASLGPSTRQLLFAVQCTQGSHEVWGKTPADTASSPPPVFPGSCTTPRSMTVRAHAPPGRHGKLRSIDPALLQLDSQGHEGDPVQSPGPPGPAPSAPPASVPQFPGGTQGRELTGCRSGPPSARGVLRTNPSSRLPGVTPRFVSL